MFLDFADAFFDDGDPDLEKMPHTCSLDLADRGESTLEVVSKTFGVTRERIRQIEVDALEKVRVRLKARGYTEPHDVDQTLGLFENPFVDGSVDE